MNKALVILCGGDSSRMGTDKALLPFKEKTLVEYIYDKFVPYFDKIYLSVNERGVYANLNLDAKEIPDIYRNAGPVGGILSALTMISEEKAFFMSIDTPFMDPRIASFLFDFSDNFDITTYNLQNEFFDTVCAIYSKHCISALGKCILKHNVTKEYFYSKCNVNLIDSSKIDEISTISPEQQFFAIKDRESYYMSLFSILKHNFIC